MQSFRAVLQLVLLAGQIPKFAYSFRPHFTLMSPTAILMSTTSDTESARNSKDEMVTILGFGSLLSERSSRTTFPELQNFRLGRVPNYRRVFGHPASIFFQRGIANLKTKEMSSLSAEYCEGNPGFVCSIFEVPNNDMLSDGAPSQAFLEREEEFNIVTDVSHVDFENPVAGESRKAILCTSSTDDAYLERWGSEQFDKQYGKYGVHKIWGWERNSGLRPCPVYLRHCYLAAESMGDECFNSFLDETFLVDRATTVRDYVQQFPEILDTMPPPELVGRYSG
jgi:hypothetical protein